jgi:hypothetical protein
MAGEHVHRLMSLYQNLLFYQKLGFEEEDRHMQDGYHRVFLHKVLA